MASALAQPTSGLDLRIRRTVAGATQTELARVLRVSRQRIGQIEGMYRPPVQSVGRYLEALAELAGRYGAAR